MLVNYPEIKALIRDHQNQIDVEVKKYRLMKRIRPSKPTVKDRLLFSLGRHLIAAGSKLQNLAKPDLYPHQGDYQAC